MLTAPAAAPTENVAAITPTAVALLHAPAVIDAAAPDTAICPCCRCCHTRSLQFNLCTVPNERPRNAADYPCYWGAICPLLWLVEYDIRFVRTRVDSQDWLITNSWFDGDVTCSRAWKERCFESQIGVSMSQNRCFDIADRGFDVRIAVKNGPFLVEIQMLRAEVYSIGEVVGQNVSGQNVTDKMSRTNCYVDKMSLDKMSRTKCRGQNVVVKMSWSKCRGQNVVVKMLRSMSGTKCRGQNVVVNMFWLKCSGQDAPGIVVHKMSWFVQQLLY